MQRVILAVITILLAAFTGISAYGQTTDKADKPQTTTTTADAWNQALPEGVQPYYNPTVVAEESTDNVESEETPAQIEKRILGLEKRLMESLKLRDSISLNSLLADDFVIAGVNIAGSKTDKDRFIEWTLKTLELKSYNLEKTVVRAYPATAIVTSNYNRQASIGGVASDGDFTVTDVWIKRGKRWQAVSHHISPVKP